MFIFPTSHLRASFGGADACLISSRIFFSGRNLPSAVLYALFETHFDRAGEVLLDFTHMGDLSDWLDGLMKETQHSYR